MYDFGKKGNQEHYGQDTPPVYNMEKVTAPVACYWSENDWMAAPEVPYERSKIYKLLICKKHAD